MYYLDVEGPIQQFEKTIRNEIYVDKSLLIERTNKVINTQQNYICITRPRRFGKTINANMLAAYYTTGYNTNSQFEKLQIAKTLLYETHLNQHHVIYIDFSRLPSNCDSYNDYIHGVESRIIKDIYEAYGCVMIGDESIHELFLKTKNKFIFILDEWDSVFYESFMTQEHKSSFLKFLKGLLKDQPYVELAYMTGVLPIAKYSSGSELNMFEEFNFMKDGVYEHFFGFHEKEVKKLCEDFKSISYEDLKFW